MGGVEAKSQMRAPPSLATTYEGDDPSLLERLVPLIDIIEIAPDAISSSDGKRA